MEDAFETFNKTMEEYNEAYTAAETDKDRAEVDSKFEKLIDKAEAVLEADLEASIEKADKELESEQKADEDALRALEKATDEKIAAQEKEAMPPTKTEVRKLKEAELVELAESMGIEASVKDRKSDTLKKVLAAL